MKISLKIFAAALAESLLETKPADYQKIIKSFVILLAKKNILRYGSMVADEFKKYLNEKENILPVKIETAQTLDSAKIKKIEQLLKKMTNKTIEIETEINPKLIAGFKIFFSDLLIDFSLLGKLKGLKRFLEVKD